MRRLWIAAGVAAALVAGASLTGCAEKTETAEAPAPVKKKSLARQDQMYAGEEQIQSITTATATKDAANVLSLKVEGSVPSAGYTRAGFLPRIYAATPPDGIYEVDVVALKPSEPVAQAVTAIKADGAWNKYADDRVKGVTFISKTNSVTVMATPEG